MGKGFNDSEVEGLFVATPPLEALRLLLSWVATDMAGLPTGYGSRRQRTSILIADVSRAFLEVPAKRDVVVFVPLMTSIQES